MHRAFGEFDQWRFDDHFARRLHANLPVVDADRQQVATVAVGERQRLRVVVERDQQALFAAQDFQRRFGWRAVLVGREVAASPPAAAPDRSRRVTGFEFDPHAGADRRDAVQADSGAGVGRAGCGPGGEHGIAEHLGNLRLDATDRCRVLVVGNQATVLAEVACARLRREFHHQTFEGSAFHQNTPAKSPPPPVLPAERALRCSAKRCR
ncbi:MAG: hypothetical protein CAPSK01_002431 [Candidatus Accumulibacter vicinus]|uniref:Uncharacterized protein n=1 Tax=Candidatus Accumulibacter vicinus TaxID=2954382 RepID=A0A084XZE9_9PROT|nr:MAG: hypothetical protein CAPSK01_002431 [Candidatus Accumulibacter vicinus]